jgi:hypothetical protein
MDVVRALPGLEPRSGSPAAFLWAVRGGDEVIDEDEAGDLVHDRTCPTPLSPGRPMLASTDRVHCPNCGDTGARNRPIILPLGSVTQ